MIIDALGNPRILDGNGEGLAIVDVGAVEVELVIPDPETLLFALTALVTVAFHRYRPEKPAE